MKDEESVDIPKGLFQKIAHLFYSYLNECWIRRLKLLENDHYDDLVVQANNATVVLRTVVILPRVKVKLR